LKSTKTKKAYICGNDWYWELSEDQPSAVKFYNTVEHLKKDSTCWTECGIVEVEIKINKWIEESKPFSPTKGE